MEERGVLLCQAGLQGALHTGDCARVTMRVGTPLLAPLIHKAEVEWSKWKKK